MGEVMTFPDTVEEFMEQYKITDTEQVYTNGTELVPIFRMNQWFENHKDAKDINVPARDCISRQQALKALRKCQTYLYDARDPELKIELSSAEAAINNLPTIQTVATDTNVGDKINRQAVIDELRRFKPEIIPYEKARIYVEETVKTMYDRVVELPTIQPEPTYEQVEEYCKRRCLHVVTDDFFRIAQPEPQWIPCEDCKRRCKRWENLKTLQE